MKLFVDNCWRDWRWVEKADAIEKTLYPVYYNSRHLFVCGVIILGFFFGMEVSK